MRRVLLLIVVLTTCLKVQAQSSKHTLPIAPGKSSTFFSEMASLAESEEISIDDAMKRFNLDPEDARFPINSERRRIHYSWKLDENTIVVMGFSTTEDKLLGVNLFIKPTIPELPEHMDSYVLVPLYWDYFHGLFFDYETKANSMMKEELIFPKKKP